MDELNEKEIVQASVLSMKKAVSMYNNLLNPERIEDFIINCHISMNRLMIAYCIKNNLPYKKENGKVESFDDLIKIIAKNRFFLSKEKNFFLILNQLRNSIAHFYVKKEDVESKLSYIVLSALIYIWQRLKVKVVGSPLNYYTLFLLPSDINWSVEKEVGVEDSKYLNKINSLSINPLFQEMLKKTSIVLKKIEEENNIDDQEELLRIQENNLPPGKIVEMMQEYYPGFNLHLFMCITKVFSIRTYKCRSLADVKCNPKYTIRSNNPIKDSILYRKIYFEKILEIYMANKENYLPFFKNAYRKGKSFEIETFSWDDEYVKSFLFQY